VLARTLQEDDFDFNILPKDITKRAEKKSKISLESPKPAPKEEEDEEEVPIHKKTSPILPVQQSLYLIQTVGWTALSFFIIWAIIQIFQKLVSYPYHYNFKFSDERYMKNPQNMPQILPKWLSLAIFAYNSSENDIQRKINIYFLKGVIYPLFLLIGFVPIAVIFFSDNQLSSYKLVFIDLLRVGAVFVMCSFIFELTYRSHTMWLTILHHWGAIINCILLLLWELDNLAYFKIVMVYGIFMFLEGPEMFIMIFFRVFGDTGTLEQEHIQDKMNHYLIRSRSDMSLKDVNLKFREWRRTVTKWMLGLTIFDAITKIMQQTLIFILLIEYWNLMNVELRITLVVSYIIFFLAQAYGPYIFFMIYLKMRNLNAKEDREKLIGKWEMSEKLLEDKPDRPYAGIQYRSKSPGSSAV
jgi:hypothetical protein